MQTIRETQKRDYIEEFNCVAALYSVLKTNSAAMRVNKVETVMLNRSWRNGYCAGGVALPWWYKQYEGQFTQQKAELEVKVKHERLDFVLDVEIRVKRRVGQVFYDRFLRAVNNENLETLSETLQEVLGKTFWEYGLGPNGAYANLYFDIKNSQVRSYMLNKKEQNGIFGTADADPDTATGAALDFGYTDGSGDIT